MFFLFKFHQDYGKCPITGEPLTLDDIVPIQTGKVSKLCVCVSVCVSLFFWFSGFFIILLWVLTGKQFKAYFYRYFCADSEAPTGTGCKYSRDVGNVSNCTCICSLESSCWLFSLLCFEHCLAPSVYIERGCTIFKL